MDKLPSILRYNDNAVSFTIPEPSGGNRVFYWSYNTCVAFERFSPERPATQRFCRVRRNRDFSQTTGRHLVYMGVADWPRVDDETFERLATGGQAP